MYVFLTAMNGEAQALVNRLDGVEKQLTSGVTFYTGRYAGKQVAVVKSGVGKVNSAHATLLAIARFCPQGILDTGIAGGLGVSAPMDVVAATAFCQHDMDTSPLGDPPGLLDGLGRVFLPTDEGMNAILRRALPGAKWGIVATGDQFVASNARAEQIRAAFGAIACEMEGGAAAQIAALHGVPFAAIRVISDGGTSGAQFTYEQVQERAETLCAHLMCRFLEEER